jgi:hypothetical protein
MRGVRGDQQGLSGMHRLLPETAKAVEALSVTAIKQDGGMATLASCSVMMSRFGEKADVCHAQGGKQVIVFKPRQKTQRQHKEGFIRNALRFPDGCDLMFSHSLIIQYQAPESSIVGENFT